MVGGGGGGGGGLLLEFGPDSLGQLLEADGSLLGRRPIDSLPHVAVPGVRLDTRDHREVGWFISSIQRY